jgi:uncharacterized protein
LVGTIINIIAVLVGGAVGMLAGARLPERVRSTIVTALGLFTVLMGIRLFLKTENILIVLGSLLVGALLGEWWRIEDRLQALGGWLESRWAGGQQEPDAQKRFVRGFLVSSLVFCVGPMTILGAIQDGLTGDYSLLTVKSVLDLFAALAFASALGVGVLFSVITLLVYQGGLSLLAAQLQALITPSMMGEMEAVGGVILVGLAVGSLLEIKPVRAGNFLPALVLAPLLVALLDYFGIVI